MAVSSFESGSWHGGESDYDRFLHLFLSHHKQIFGYIVSLVPNYNDAEDILQETASIMWHKFKQFEPGTNFVGWGIAIAKYRIIKYRKKQRNKVLQFDAETLERIMVASEVMVNQLADRINALQGCVNKLSESDR